MAMDGVHRRVFLSRQSGWYRDVGGSRAAEAEADRRHQTQVVTNEAALAGLSAWRGPGAGSVVETTSELRMRQPKEVCIRRV